MTRDELLGQIESAALELGELVGDTHAPMLGQRILEAVRKLKESPPIDPDAQAREAEELADEIEHQVVRMSFVRDKIDVRDDAETRDRKQYEWETVAILAAKWLHANGERVSTALSQTAALRARVAELEAGK